MKKWTSIKCMKCRPLRQDQTWKAKTKLVQLQRRKRGIKKKTNQFLAILDIFRDNPETLKVKFNSANFGTGTYPNGAKHRWLIRTRAGYSLSIDVKEVDLEKDLDTLTVYDVQSSWEKKVLGEVSVAKKLHTFSSRVLAVFKSNCSVNRRGFSAVVIIVKNKWKSKFLVIFTFILFMTIKINTNYF